MEFSVNPAIRIDGVRVKAVNRQPEEPGSQADSL
jgi:hypothetical protein